MNSAHLYDLIFYCSPKPFSGSNSVETAQSFQAGHAFNSSVLSVLILQAGGQSGRNKKIHFQGLQKLPESFSVRLTSKSCSCLYFSEEMVMQASSCILTETGCWEMRLLREKYSFVWLGLPRSPLKVNDIFTGRGEKSNRHTTDWPESLCWKIHTWGKIALWCLSSGFMFQETILEPDGVLSLSLKKKIFFKFIYLFGYLRSSLQKLVRSSFVVGGLFSL